jgi:phospholipase C
MKLAAQCAFLLMFPGMVLAQAAPAFPSQIKNVVVIVQENRTPDNLFQGLSPKCPILSLNPVISCTPVASTSCYDVSSCGLSNQSGTLAAIPLAGIMMKGSADPSHSHTAWHQMCDPDATTHQCHNDGAWQILPSNGSYAFVENIAVTNYNGQPGHLLDPYITFAEQYGWSNFMYQTNQGPSYPAHQFLFSGTSALSATGDTQSTFVSENFSPAPGMNPPPANSGCLTAPNGFSKLLSPNLTGSCPSGCSCFDNNTVKECKLVNTGVVFPTDPVGTFCVTQHESMADLLDPAGVTWKYYAPGPGSIWTAPNAIQAICVPAFDANGNLFCSGSEWNSKVDVKNLGTDILTDITGCNLQNVSWVIPNGTWSDHAGATDNWGPSWVAAIINAIGNNPTCPTGTPDAGQNFWQNTAIVVTWDDWGGWSDNQPAVILTPGPPCTSTNCPGDYQYGFRVPLLVVSAYTPQGTINDNTHDFGSILRMIESVNGIAPGSLGFADARASNNLRDFFTLTTPRTYQTVFALKDANFFLQQALSNAPFVPPDDDDDD